MMKSRLPVETDIKTQLADCLPAQPALPGVLTGSEYPSPAPTRSDAPGPEHTDRSDVLIDYLIPLLEEAWTTGFTVSSDFARKHAEIVAMAASLQLITTRITRDLYGRHWQVTSKGLRFLNEHKECSSD